MASREEESARSAEAASEESEALQWQAAMARARRRTYEGTEPSPADHAFPDAHAGDAIPTSAGHAWRGPQMALGGTSRAPVVRRWPAVLLTAAAAAALAGGAGFVMKQDYDRVLQGKDKLLARVEAQKALAQEQRDKALADLNTERATLMAQVEDMRAQRNAAMIAAGLPPPADAPKPVAGAKAGDVLPKLPVKTPVSDDPLSGLRDIPSDAKKPSKRRHK